MGGVGLRTRQSIITMAGARHDLSGHPASTYACCASGLKDISCFRNLNECAAETCHILWPISSTSPLPLNTVTRNSHW